VLGQARLADPRAQQERLPAARRRRYQGHPRRSRKPRGKGTAGDDPPVDSRNDQGGVRGSGGGSHRGPGDREGFTLRIVRQITRTT
jgi:hypothetical protein